MTSYRDGKPTGLAKSRLAGDVILAGRQAVARFANRPVIAVRRYCVPIACDVGTRAFLYDLDSCVAELNQRRVA